MKRLLIVLALPLAAIAQPAPGTEPVVPSEPGTEPSEPGTEPGEPGTEPSEPGTEPGEPGTEPGEPGTEPGEPGDPTGPGADAAGASGAGANPGQPPINSTSANEPGPSAKKITVAKQRPPLSPEELKVLSEVEADFDRFKGIADEQYKHIRAQLRREFDNRRKSLDRRYAQREREVLRTKRKQDLRLIALLERFIEEHPDHKKFTPDAMFRLASLYLSEAEYEIDLKEAQQDAGVFLEDEELIADYSRALDMWQRIIVKFPKYRQMPSVLYLLAHYGRASDERKSLQVFLALACHNRFDPLGAPPRELTREEVQLNVDSRILVDHYKDCKPYPGADKPLILHAWARGIGPHHFNTPGELDYALSAFSKVTKHPDSPLYMEALYNEAWTYYRRDFLQKAIAGFDKSVMLYDKTVAEGKQPTLALREEALQYIAVAFTDPWEGELDTDPAKAFERIENYYKGREDEKHTREIWKVSGNAFLELQAYDQAIAAYMKAINKPWNLHPDNPVVHQDIVDAYEAKGDKFAADAAAGELATRYAPGTEWYTANEKDREAMANYHRIGERMLYASARNLHGAATKARLEYEEAETKDPALKAEYLAIYDKASNLYLRFIEQYPESEYVYEFMYAVAETKYFGEKYNQAIDYYKWVRDHRSLSEKYFAQAALSVIQSYEAVVAIEVAAGRLPPMKVPDAATLKSLPKPIQPKKVPPLYAQLRDEWDKYQRLAPNPRTAPVMGLNAAKVSVSYLDLPDAEKRFKKVMNNFCGTDEAVKAKDGLLAIYDARGLTKEFQKTNEEFVAKKCGDKEAIAKALGQNRSLEFRKAGELYANGDYQVAANQYYKYYKTAPETDKDLPTALFNAALSLRKANKPRSSIALLEEFTRSENKAFKESPFYLEALRQTAKSYQSAYDYKTAVKTYMALYEKAKKAKAAGLKPPPDPAGNPQNFDAIKLDALYNAASLSELDRNFTRAVSLYRQYETEEPDRAKSDAASWAVARIYLASGNTRSLDKAYDAWRKKYGNDPGNADRYVRSYYDQAQLYAEKQRTRDADKSRLATIKAWKAKGSKKNTVGAKLAGEFELYFAEQHYQKKWLSFRIKRQAKDIKTANKYITQINKASKEAEDQFFKLDQYGVLDYSMAAKVRYGDILSQYGPKILEMPTPKQVLKLDEKYPDQDVLLTYESKVLERVKPKLAAAKKQWTEVVDVAKKNGISNKWTQIAAENLAQEFPDEFQVLHQELVDGTEQP